MEKVFSSKRRPGGSQRTFVIMSGSEGKPEPASGIRGATMPIVRAAQYGLDSSYLSCCEDDLCTHFCVPILLLVNNNLIFRFLSPQNFEND